MKSLLFYCKGIFIFSSIILLAASCTKDKITPLPVSPRLGIINGYVYPAEVKAIVFISNGFFNGRDLPFDANVDADPVTGKYSIENVPEGTYVLEAIPTNSDYKSKKIQDVVINANYTTSINFSLDKN